jgi:hypothetical protein
MLLLLFQNVNRYDMKRVFEFSAIDSFPVVSHNRALSLEIPDAHRTVVKQLYRTMSRLARTVTCRR